MAKRFKNVYQFKVELEHVRPAIWRTIQVPETYSFWDLHVAVQDAMGWKDCHLHAFRVRADGGAMTLVGIPDDDGFNDGPEFLPGWEVAVADHLTKPGDAVLYEYDFGDGWEHRLILEEVLPRTPRARYPRCVAGARACPPEDCGGVPGYERLLQILGDPRHEEHEDMREWVGGPFDAKRFDPASVRFANPQKRWDRVFGGRSDPAPPTGSTLERILEGPSAPDDAMTYCEAHGFLFAVACAPDMVPPSGWIPMIFGGEPEFDTRKEAEAVFGELMQIFNTISGQVADDEVELPDCCFFLRDVRVNFEIAAPMHQWSLGFVKGHNWLGGSWDGRVPEEKEKEHLLHLTVLGFFASRKLAEEVLRESTGPKRTMKQLGETMRAAFGTAMDSYARLGHALHLARMERGVTPPVRKRTAGRNDPCPCGSGKKFKKCCIGGGSQGHSQSPGS